MALTKKLNFRKKERRKFCKKNQEKNIVKVLKTDKEMEYYMQILRISSDSLEPFKMENCLNCSFDQKILFE